VHLSRSVYRVRAPPTRAAPGLASRPAASIRKRTQNPSVDAAIEPEPAGCHLKTPAAPLVGPVKSRLLGREQVQDTPRMRPGRASWARGPAEDRTASRLAGGLKRTRPGPGKRNRSRWVSPAQREEDRKPPGRSERGSGTVDDVMMPRGVPLSDKRHRRRRGGPKAGRWSGNGEGRSPRRTSGTGTTG